MTGVLNRSAILHIGVVILLFALQFVLPPYHHTNMARIMTLAVFAMGYNVAFGYTGLLSLGHALFFASGLYAAGLLIQMGGWSALPAFSMALIAGGGLALLVGVLALRTTGVAFMIVTLMFAQAGYLTVLYLGEWTRGDEGLVLPAASRTIGSLDLTNDTTRYFCALALFSIALLGCYLLARSSTGRVLIAMRENEERSRMLGYDPLRYRLTALVISAVMSAAAGAAYGVLFGYVGATFASIQYSIFPLLWVLLGGAGTVLGPFLGVLLMTYLVDLAGDVTSAHLLVVGIALVLTVLFAPRGLLGTVRARWLPWLP